MEIISQYIKKYFEKNNKHPKTKIKFYKYGCLLEKCGFGKLHLSLHTLTVRLIVINQ